MILFKDVNPEPKQKWWRKVSNIIGDFFKTGQNINQIVIIIKSYKTGGPQCSIFKSTSISVELNFGHKFVFNILKYV